MIHYLHKCVGAFLAELLRQVVRLLGQVLDQGGVAEFAVFAGVTTVKVKDGVEPGGRGT